MNTALILRSLQIRNRDYYSRTNNNSPIQYEGQIEFAGSNGEVKINLSSDLSQKVLAVVAEAMVESTRQVAHDLTAEILAGVPALPRQSTRSTRESSPRIDTMSLKKSEARIEYEYVCDGQDAYAGDAVLLEQNCACKIIKHRARVVVEYLVEYHSGERKWKEANR